MKWIALRITPESNRDGVIAALFESGSQGVQEDGRSVLTHFPAGAPLNAITSAVLTVDPHADISIAETPDTDYSQWRARVSAHEVGALMIAPPWLADGLDQTRTVIVEPAMAFGTGEHPTTRGAMRLMQGVIRAGDVVADLGTGSGILSIAAIKLGAARVAAIEIDHDSIANAEENIRANLVDDCVEVIEGDATTLLPLLAPVRVVIANIISSVIVPMLPMMKTSLAADGQAILSGILFDEREQVLAALQSGWMVQREDMEDSWWSVQIAPQ